MVMKFTNNMLQMNPTVPNTLIGGKAFTVSIPYLSRPAYATEFDNAIVGM